MSEVLNRNFEKVFATKSYFKKPQGQVRKNEMLEIRINREEIEEMMKELKERKAIGPDEVSGYILKECRQEMAEPIHDIQNFPPYKIHLFPKTSPKLTQHVIRRW